MQRRVTMIERISWLHTAAIAAASLNGALALCACNVSDPVEPPVTGAHQEPEHSGEQAESALTVAESPSGSQTVATGYNWTGTAPLPVSGLADIYYGSDAQCDAIVLRGASAMGHAWSSDGFTWNVGNKISTADPALAKHGDSVSVLWGDPAIASGYVNKKLVAYTNMAISDAAFNANARTEGSVTFLPYFPRAECSPAHFDLLDSLCVALSQDGGQSYPDLVCVTAAQIGGVDETAVGIDKNDKIWIATSTAFGLHLYVVAPSPLGPLLQPAAVGTFPYAAAPRIARDQDGELWLAATDRGTSTTGLCHISGGPFSSPSCSFVGQMVTGDELGFTGGNLYGVLSATVLTFGVNRVEGSHFSVPRTDFYFAYQVSNNPNSASPQYGLAIQAGECTLRLATLQCAMTPSWGTGTSGEFFQPVMSVVDRSVAQDGSEPDVEYSYYEGDTDNEPSGHARVRRAVLHGSAFGTNSATFQDLPFAPPPTVCAADYTVGSTDPSAIHHYWGDYFAYGFVPHLAGSSTGGHVAVFSSDEGLGCDNLLNPLNVGELHLQSWFWPN